MKTLRMITFLFIVGTATIASAQEGEGKTEEKEKRTIKEVEQVNEASEEISATAANTAESLKSTAANTKDAVNEIGALFGAGKGTKKAKSKGMVSISIQPISYDDENLNKLFTAISKAKGAKNPSKNFSGNSVLITVAYKGSADALWQSIPREIRTTFQIGEMADSSIAVQPKVLD